MISKSMNCCNIFEGFDEKSNLIKEYQHWILLVKNRNVSLGKCVAITKQHHESLSEISPAEMVELVHVAKEIETALKKSFAYDKINWLMLMMKERHHTHFNIIPRYKTPREFAGIKWIDNFDPDPLAQRHPDVSPEVLRQVKEKIRENL